MEFFALDEEVARLEQALAGGGNGSGRLDTLLALAWALRQRDGRRSLSLVSEAQSLSDAGARPDAPSPARQAAARVALVRAEAALLGDELEAARTLAQGALQTFESLADPEGCADAHWLLAMQSTALGDLPQQKSHLEAVAGGGCPVRAEIAQLLWSTYQAERGAPGGARLGGAAPAPAELMRHPAVVCQDLFFRGMSGGLSGDFAAALPHFIESYTLALATGQIRAAVITATNIGDCLTSLNEYQGGLEWMERGLELARSNGWPGMLGFSLCQTANLLCKMARHETARMMLDEAVALMAARSSSQHYAIALAYLGDAELACGLHAKALDTFTAMERMATPLDHGQFLCVAARGQSMALLRLGQPRRALAMAQAALGSADSPDLRIAALQALAAIHSAGALPPPEGMQAASAPLHYLLQALEVAERIGGFIVPPDLLESVARAWAEVGRQGQAYAFALQALAAREKVYHQEAANRANALQATHESERARAEAEHLRQLAASEARRAATLEQTSATLERLSAVGQEITACREADQITALLHRHVSHLLDVHSFVLLLLEPDGRHLWLAYGVEGGACLQPARIAVSSTVSLAACAVRERREILINLLPEPEGDWIPGTATTRSLLYVPLTLGERLLGVMTTQSFLRNAYGERELLIFRSLCAYGAIALANAEAIVSLRAAQAHLAQQERMAALGGLVAGVAHEVNTPLGVTLTALSAVDTTVQQLRGALADGTLGRGQLQSGLDVCGELSALARSNACRAANLVASFKAVAVQSEHDAAQAVDLPQLAQDLALLVRADLERRGHRISHSVAPGLSAHVVAEALTDALGRILANVRDHAFERREGGGLVELTARRDGDGWLELAVSDNGCGIPPEALPKVFDPFFTTGSGSRGHVGLGLHVVYNQVTHRLGGTVSVASTPGVGTTVTLRLPP